MCLIIIIFFIFIYSVQAFVTFLSMEMSLIPLFLLMANSSPTNESVSASVYLVTFTVVFSSCYLLDMVLNKVMINKYQWYHVLSFSAITFFAKLPVYSLHQWLPNAHVECVTLSSVVLASLLLNMGLPMVGVYYFNITLGSIIVIMAILSMVNTMDFNVWVAFSSISHMSLLFTGLYLFMQQGVYYYFIVHTFLSSCMFYYFASTYNLKSSRNFFFFDVWHAALLVFLWVSVPLTINFLTELWVMKLMCLVAVHFFLFFIALFSFVFVSVKFLWASDMINTNISFSQDNKYWSSIILFMFFWLLI